MVTQIAAVVAVDYHKDILRSSVFIHSFMYFFVVGIMNDNTVDR